MTETIASAAAPIAEIKIEGGRILLQLYRDAPPPYPDTVQQMQVEEQGAFAIEAWFDPVRPLVRLWPIDPDRLIAGQEARVFRRVAQILGQSYTWRRRFNLPEALPAWPDELRLDQDRLSVATQLRYLLKRSLRHCIAISGRLVIHRLPFPISRTFRDAGPAALARSLLLYS